MSVVCSVLDPGWGGSHGLYTLCSVQNVPSALRFFAFWDPKWDNVGEPQYDSLSISDTEYGGAARNAWWIDINAAPSFHLKLAVKMMTWLIRQHPLLRLDTSCMYMQMFDMWAYWGIFGHNHLLCHLVRWYKWRTCHFQVNDFHITDYNSSIT